MKIKPVHKEIAILLLLDFSGLIFWLSYSSYVQSAKWELAALFWSQIAAFFALATLWGLAMVLVESTIIAILAWAIFAFLPLLWAPDVMIVLSSSVLFLFGSISLFRGKYEMRNTLRGGLFRALRRTLPLMATFLALAAAVFAYIIAPNVSIDIEEFVPERVFERIVNISERVIEKQVPGFKASKLFSEYTLEQAVLQSGEESGPISENEQAFIVRSAVREMNERYGIVIAENDALSRVLYLGALKIAKDQIPFSNAQWIPIVFAVGLFIAIRFFAVPIYWAGIVSVIILVKLLFHAGVIELRKINTELIGYSFL